MDDEVWRQFAIWVEVEVDWLADERLDGAGRVEEPVVEHHSAETYHGAWEKKYYVGPMKAI